jgi:phenylacetate-CoA ligase
MNIANYIKKNAHKLPIGIRIGNLISHLSYSRRPGIGSSYIRSSVDLDLFEKNKADKKRMIFNKLYRIVDYAINNTVFYKEFYADNNFSLEQLKSFSDIKYIPIVTKSDLSSYKIEHITNMDRTDLQLSNTGGSTGQPFEFYVTSNAMGHEWAHVHRAWEVLGFTPDKLKVMFAGRSRVKNFVDYDLIRHSLVVDIYADFDSIADKLIKYNKIKKIKYLHGYPSAIFEFACYCQDKPLILNTLMKSLKGVFLTSEYPHSYFREKIEKVFQVKTQSFYGHTERCIMGYENEDKGTFNVLQSYGYCEVVENQLIGTSYESFGTPLIRYATGDKVTNFAEEDGIVNSFRLQEGRTGEFVIDSGGKKITLTGLIFGRHHKIFNYVSHIQVFQKKLGLVTIVYCSKAELPEDPADLFDSHNVNIMFDFLRVSEPIKTISGKFKLIIDELPIIIV